VLELRNIVKIYQGGTVNETCLFNDFNLTIPDGQFVHFDTPLTEEHEMQILRDAGFTEVYVDPTPEDSHIVIAKK